MNLSGAIVFLAGLTGISLSAVDFSNHTYTAISGTFTWPHAKADAEARGGHLATITSQAELEYIASIGAFPTDPYWLGGTDEGHEGTWVWVTGEPWDYTWWAPGEPNNLGIENYVAGSTGTTSNNTWNDWGHDGLTLPNYLLEVELCTPHRARTVVQLADGVVVSATITDAGCGYSNSPAVLIQGGGGSGATATAQVANGRVVSITITAGGCCYTNVPIVLVASPPFQPSVAIQVSQVRVRQHVMLAHHYVLESSNDLKDWTPVGPIFTADAEIIDTVFDVDSAGRYFRVREVP